MGRVLPGRQAPTPFDLVIVDETHRLTQYAVQAMGTLTRDFRAISKRLARPGEDWESLTQIDWIIHSGRHQVFLLDEGQASAPPTSPTPASTPSAASPTTLPVSIDCAHRCG